MHIDFSGAELFLDYLAGRATAQDVLQHPESTGGLEAVRRAFYLDADRFMGEYRNLLDSLSG